MKVSLSELTKVMAEGMAVAAAKLRKNKITISKIYWLDVELVSPSDAFKEELGQMSREQVLRLFDVPLPHSIDKLNEDEAAPVILKAVQKNAIRKSGFLVWAGIDMEPKPGWHSCEWYYLSALTPETAEIILGLCRARKAMHKARKSHQVR